MNAFMGFTLWWMIIASKQIICMMKGVHVEEYTTVRAKATCLSSKSVFFTCWQLTWGKLINIPKR